MTRDARFRSGIAGSRAALLLCAAAAGALACLLALPPRTAAALRPASGGTVRLALPAVPAGLDPLEAVGPAERAVSGLVYDTLVRLDAAGRPRPHLALDWRLSADRLHLTFWLRPGVAFHGGRDCRALDVKRSLERLADPRWGAGLAWLLDGVEGLEAFAAGRAAEITGIRAVGAYRLDLQLVRPTDLLPAALAHPQAAVVPAEIAGAGPPAGAADRSGGGFQPRAVLVPGTGPFRPVPLAAAGGAGASGRFHLAANPDYFAGRPYLDRVELVAEPDAGRARLRLDIGEVDVVALAGAEGAGGLPAARPGGLVAVVWLNAGRAPLTDVAVRQALAAAIDRESLVQAFAPGATPATALVPEPVAPLQPRSPRRPYAGPGGARAALEAALGPGRRLRPLALLVPADEPALGRVAERLQVNFLDTGAEVHLEPLPAAALERRLAAGDYDLALALWAPGLADPLAVYLAAALRGGPVAAAAARAARSGLEAADLGVKVRRLLDADAALAEAVVVLPLYHPRPAVWHRPGLFDLAVGPAGEPRLADAWLDPRAGVR